MQQKPDVIVLESLFLVRYVKAIRSVSEATLVIRAHNVEYQLWEQQAEAAAFPKKSYLKHLAKTLRREELKGLNNVDQIWTITHEDEQQLQKLGVTNPIVTIPVAVETGEKLPDYANTDFFHLGSLNWEPNKLAVRRLLKDIWPDFAERYQSTLHIAGAFSDDFTMEFVQRVKIHGFAEDAAAFMLEHGTLAAPVVSGSGVRIKLLEAMSLGIPCITTALGAAGIAHPEEQLRLAGTNAEWLAALTEFAASEDIRRNYGLRGRAYMEKYHSFASVTAQILAALGR
jgi:glycosyltransferase involved in cell wall biosynthesis